MDGARDHRMNAPSITKQSDAQLWLKAVLVSVVLNGLLVVALAFMAIHSLFMKEVPPTPSEPEPRSVMIVAVAPEVAPEPAAAPEPRGAKPFARSTPEQESEAPENPAFIGERDTQATSDAPPVANAPEMPSQKGEKPKYGEMETTESNYQDGDLAHDLEGAPGEAKSAVAEQKQAQLEKIAAIESELGGTNEMIKREDKPAPPKEILAETPFPVERPALPMEKEEEPKSAPEEVRKESEKTEKKEEVAENPKQRVDPSPAGNQGFRGNQRKTELKGSISRSGHSAVDMEAGAIGKYQAAIGRAIEKSWQRKMIENRDYILPGSLSLRVVLDPQGKVRSILPVNEYKGGIIQKGFTHSAIREADLPAMPAEVKSELDGDPLELLYNFIF